MATATEVSTPTNGDQKKAPTLGDQQRALIARVADRRASVPARVKSMGEFIKLVASRQGVFDSMPKHCTPDRITDVYLSCFRANPKLLDCTPESLVNALRQSASYGLEVGGVMGQAYLVPYGPECTFMPGYKGLIDLVRRTGEVSTAYAEIVREGDYFKYRLGDDPLLEHEPLMDDDPESRRITHVYAIFRLRNGGVQRRVWTTGQVDAHKSRFSQAWQRAERNGKKDSPWHTDWVPMAKKSLMRAMISSGEVPTSAEVRDLVASDITAETVEGTVIRKSDAPRLEQKSVSGLLGLTSQLEGDMEDLPGMEQHNTVHDVPQQAEPPRRVAPSSRPATRAHSAPAQTIPMKSQEADAQEADYQQAAGDDPHAETEMMLDALQQELLECTAIKGCKDIGQRYIASYSKGPEDMDLIIQCVAQRQSAIRLRKGEAASDPSE